jgi:hypothetical protein
MVFLDPNILVALSSYKASNISPNDRDDPQGALGEFELQDSHVEKAKIAEELAEQKRQNQRKVDDHQFKLWLAIGLFLLLVVYLGIVLCIVVANGVGCIKNQEAVLISLLGTTSVNVIGLFVIVAKYFFPHDNPSNPS